MRYFKIVLLVAGFALSYGLSDASAEGIEAPVYRIATVSWAGWSPLHVADELGFWRDAGVNVRVRNYDDPIVILEAIKAGHIDFAMDMVGSLVGIYMQGTPVVALAETNWSHGGDRIIIKRGTMVHQHVGGTLGVFLQLPACLFFLGQYLDMHGLKLDQFRIVELNPDDMTEQFIAGRLPVIVNYDPWALEAIRRGNGVVLATSADFEGSIPECIWGYRKRLSEIPETHIKAILAGWIRAAVWANDPANLKAFGEILNRRTYPTHDAYAADRLRLILAGVRIHNASALYERNRKDGGLYDYLRQLRGFLKSNKRLQKDFDPEDIFKNRFIMEALGKYPQPSGNYRPVEDPKEGAHG